MLLVSDLSTACHTSGIKRRIKGLDISRPVGSFLKRGVQILHQVRTQQFASRVAQVLKNLMGGGGGGGGGWRLRHFENLGQFSRHWVGVSSYMYITNLYNKHASKKKKTLPKGGCGRTHHTPPPPPPPPHSDGHDILCVSCWGIILDEHFRKGHSVWKSE